MQSNPTDQTLTNWFSNDKYLCTTLYVLINVYLGCQGNLKCAFGLWCKLRA